MVPVPQSITQFLYVKLNIKRVQFPAKAQDGCHIHTGNGCNLTNIANKSIIILYISTKFNKFRQRNARDCI